MPLAIAAGVGTLVDVAANVGKAGYGAYQTIKGNNDYNNLVNNRPVRTTDPNILLNQQIAGAYGSQGLSSQERNAFDTEVGQNQAASINAAEKTGQGANFISQLAGQNNNQYLKELAEDAKRHQENLKQVYDANSAVAQQNILNWDYNTAEPYQEKMNRAQQQTNLGVQNIFGGATGAASGAVAGATSYANIMKSLGQKYGVPTGIGNGGSGQGAPDDGEIT